jgi:nitrous oxidase accessory protein NosD
VKIRWPRNRLERAAWGVVALAGSLAVSASWLEHWRLPSPDRFASSVFRVTTAADDGPGSLRQAILAADHAVGRARIVVAVPRIALEAVLPPLVNPSGVVFEAAQPGAEIDGTRVSGAVLDIASPGSVVSGLRIIGGGAGLVVRAPGATLRNLNLLDHDTGILLGDEAGSVRITDSSFARNRVGVYLAAPAGRTTLQNARFKDHRVAAVWAVDAASTSPAAAQIDVVGNRFDDDAIGFVAINVIARVEGNHFNSEESMAVYVSGGRATIINNQILAGHGFGIYSEQLQSGYIFRNEIARNCNGGMLLRDIANTQVIANDLYQNGYGVVLMEGQASRPNTVSNNLIADHIADGLLLIGSSPIVSGNRVLRNRQAGLRLSSLRLGSGAMRIPTPLLTGNVVRDNGLDEPQSDRYVPDTPATPPSAAAECTWRLGSPAISAVQRTGAR